MTTSMRYIVAGAVAFAVMWMVLSFQMEGMRWYTGIIGGLAFLAGALILSRIRGRK